MVIICKNEILDVDAHAALTNRELLRYLTELVEKRVEEPKDDLVSRLATEQVKTGNLSKEDAVQMAFLLLVAGNATMVNMITLVSCRFFVARRTWMGEEVANGNGLGRCHAASASRPAGRVQVGS